MRDKKDDLIVRSMADRMMPLCLVYGFYVIIHGNLSPGGGFQGGTICACAIILIYLGYGTEGCGKAINGRGLHLAEALGSVAYVVFALLGIFVGLNFCNNVFAGSGTIGEVWSGGTIVLMNYTVGIKVLAGVGSLVLLSIGLLSGHVEEEPEEGGDH